MNTRPLRFRVWDPTTSHWTGFETCIGQGYVDLSDNDPLIITQFTGLTDSKGRDIYEGDIIRYHEPHRSFQTHYGDNIPGPEGKYIEPLEPYIETRVREVRFAKGAFTFDSDADIAHNGFVWPFDMHRPAFSDREDLMQAFSCSREQAWIDNGDDETGDLSYLLREYSLATEVDLITHLNTFEVIGNVFEQPDLLK